VVFAGAFRRLDCAARGHREGGTRPDRECPAPHEIIVSGRLARPPALVARLAALLCDIAPVLALVPGRASAAAHGAALLADGLVGGQHAALTDVLRLRESGGSALDYLRVAGADSISLG
jgi:predicted butyrate kinase (DUF1464 family)